MSAVLEKRVAKAEVDQLFASGRGGGDVSKPIVKLNNAHRGAVERAKLKPFRLDDCRPTFATRATEAGVDLVKLAAMRGLSRVQMVMRYAHPTEGAPVQRDEEDGSLQGGEGLMRNELQKPTTFPPTV